VVTLASVAPLFAFETYFVPQRKGVRTRKERLFLLLAGNSILPCDKIALVTVIKGSRVQRVNRVTFGISVLFPRQLLTPPRRRARSHSFMPRRGGRRATFREEGWDRSTRREQKP